MIHYNSDGYWDNVLTTLGDLDRVQQDWGRIRFQTKWLGHAALGVHGAYMLNRGVVEHAVTWETDILTEDYWFLSRVRFCHHETTTERIDADQEIGQ